LREKEGGEFTFPMVWRNDGFATEERPLIFEARFRYSNVSPFGVTIGIGSLPYNGGRYEQSAPPIPGLEDILSIHQFAGDFRIKLLDQIRWRGTPGDESWHTVRLVLEEGTYTLEVDDVTVASAPSSAKPISLYFGNPSVQYFQGLWTHLHVDYVRVSYCAEWSDQSLPADY